MDSLLTKPFKNKNFKDALRLIEKNKPIYLLVCLLVSNTMRNIYANCIFRRKRMLSELLKHWPLPRNLYIEGTNLCNANCIFCAYNRMKRPKATMSMELFRNVIDQYVEMGGKAIGLTPIVGDPLLDRYLFERLDYLDWKRDIKNVGFYTNGIALTADKVDRILKYTNITINLSVSFGGFDRDTFKAIMGIDRFDDLKGNILHLLDRLGEEKNPNIIVKIDYRCPTDGVDPFFKLLNECVKKDLIKHDSLRSGFDNFGGLISREALEPAGLSLNFGKPKMGPCDIFFRKPLVLADGRVNACAERDLEASLIIGDLTKESLRDILSSHRLKTLIDMFYKNRPPKVCDECTIYQSIYDRRSKVWKNNLNWASKDG